MSSGTAALALFLGSALAQTNPGHKSTQTPGAADSQQSPVIRVHTDLVLIPVTVSDALNRSVLGLEKKDFQLFENGVEQNVAFFSGEDVLRAESKSCWLQTGQESESIWISANRDACPLFTIVAIGGLLPDLILRQIGAFPLKPIKPFNQRESVEVRPPGWNLGTLPEMRVLPNACQMPDPPLTCIFQCDTMSHMKTITIRELHQKTGRWVRRASEGDVYVTERGRLVAKIVPALPLPAKPFFANPRFTRAYLAHRKSLRGGTDSTETISQERDRETP